MPFFKNKKNPFLLTCNEASRGCRRPWVYTRPLQTPTAPSSTPLSGVCRHNSNFTTTHNLRQTNGHVKKELTTLAYIVTPNIAHRCCCCCCLRSLTTLSPQKKVLQHHRHDNPVTPDIHCSLQPVSIPRTIPRPKEEHYTGTGMPPSSDPEGKVLFIKYFLLWVARIDIKLDTYKYLLLPLLQNRYKVSKKLNHLFWNGGSGYQ